MTMDYRSYELPVTPPTSRTGHVLRRENGCSVASSRSWHGPPRKMPYRSQRRSREYVHPQGPSGSREWHYKKSHPRNQHLWCPPDGEKGSRGCHSNLEPMFSSLCVDDQWQGVGYPPQPKKIPRIVSPNAREQSFSEIMNGAFDLEKSPLSLGKKLANSATLRTADYLHQHPSDAGNNSDLESQHAAPSPTPVRSGKRAASSLFGSPIKHAKSDRAYFDRVDCVPSVDIVDSKNPFSTAAQRDDITVGFALSSDARAPQPTELSRLVQMIQRNTEQSKELADLVLTYLKKTWPGWNDTLPAIHLERVCTKSLAHREQSDSAPQVATLEGGGDSPDPPRDHTNPFRGHMIDQVDFNIERPADESSEPSSMVDLELDSVTTKIASVFSEVQAPSSATIYPNDFILSKKQTPSYDDPSSRMSEDTMSRSSGNSLCGVTSEVCRQRYPESTATTTKRNSRILRPSSDDLHSSGSTTSTTRGRAREKPNHHSQNWDRQTRSRLAPSPESIGQRKSNHQEKPLSSNNSPKGKALGLDSEGAQYTTAESVPDSDNNFSLYRDRFYIPVFDKKNQVANGKSDYFPRSPCTGAHRDKALLHFTNAIEPGVEATPLSCRCETCSIQSDKTDTE